MSELNKTDNYKCMICGKQATCGVQDLIERANYKTGYLECEPDGEPQFFCEAHDRKSRTRRGAPLEDYMAGKNKNPFVDLRCEICGKQATNGCRNVIRRVSYTGPFVYKPDGPYRYFCDEHKQESIIKDGPPMGEPVQEAAAGPGGSQEPWDTDNFAALIWEGFAEQFKLRNGRDPQEDDENDMLAFEWFMLGYAGGSMVKLDGPRFFAFAAWVDSLLAADKA
nr:hypothetical protein 1 [bacterium]